MAALFRAQRLIEQMLTTAPPVLLVFVKSLVKAWVRAC